MGAAAKLLDYQIDNSPFGYNVIIISLVDIIQRIIIRMKSLNRIIHMLRQVQILK